MGSYLISLNLRGLSSYHLSQGNDMSNNLRELVWGLNDIFMERGLAWGPSPATSHWPVFLGKQCLSTSDWSHDYPFNLSPYTREVFPPGSDRKESVCDAGDLGLIPGSGRSSGEGNGNLFQYSFLENSMDREAWWATVHRVTKSRTWLSG